MQHPGGAMKAVAEGGLQAMGEALADSLKTGHRR